ncbi:metallophosphoesterase family protein [Streptococcus danieliae]|nr:metallophosphoesterase family protein [Streptococcus danieliae]
MKLAVLGDIHGNLTALEAVLADADQLGVEEYWLMGDELMPGPSHLEILQILDSLPYTTRLRGNWEDSYLAARAGRYPRNKPLDLFVYRQSQHLDLFLTDAIRQDMKARPIYHHRKVGPLRFNLAHHLPQKNWGRELVPPFEQADLEALFAEDEADVAIFAHSHIQQLLYTPQGQLVLNPGSIGQPYFPWKQLRQDLRAQYLLLEIDETGLAQIDFRKVAYDVDLEIKRAVEADIPYLDFYQHLLKTGIRLSNDVHYLDSYHQKMGTQQEVEEYFAVSFSELE